MKQQRSSKMTGKDPAIGRDAGYGARRIVRRLLATAASVLLLTAAAEPEKAAAEVDCEGSARSYALQGISCYCRNGRIVCDRTSGGRGYSGSQNDYSGSPLDWIGILQQKLSDKRKQEERQRKQEAFNLNEEGNRAFTVKNWEKAVQLYRKALDKSPDDTVIKQNLRNAELEKERHDRAVRETVEHRMRTRKLLALMPVPKPLTLAAPNPAQAVPLPGFTREQWHEYLAVRETVDRLYARLLEEGMLSDVDSAAFYAALRRRNELWTLAAEQPLGAAERDKLRLSLPRVVNNNLLSAVKGMIPSGAPSAPDPAAAVAFADRRTVYAADQQPAAQDPIDVSFVSDFFAEKTSGLLDMETGKAIKEAHGEKYKGYYENLFGLGRVAVRAKEGGASAAGAEIVDLVISRMPEPMGAAGGMAVEGGRMYSNVAYQSLNRFMTDAARMTGSSFDPEAFWNAFNEDLTKSQRGVKEWIQFGK